MWCTCIGCWLFSINCIVVLDNNSLGLWDYTGMGLYNQRWPGWVVMNAWVVVYFMLSMSTIVWCYIMWNRVITLCCYSVVCLLYGIGLISYVTVQSMTVHEGWVLNRVNTLWYCSDGDYSPELTL